MTADFLLERELNRLNALCNDLNDRLTELEETSNIPQPPPAARGRPKRQAQEPDNSDNDFEVPRR